MKLSQFILKQLYSWWNTFNHISIFYLQKFWGKSGFALHLMLSFPLFCFIELSAFESTS